MKINIGIFCASFNPFHLGHLDIANKANQIFDKVIILQARNKNKDNETKDGINQADLPSRHLRKLGLETDILLPDQLLTDYISDEESISLGNKKFTIIRGLRNERDFAYEENLCAVYRNLKRNIKIIHILGDPGLNYVSSTLLRQYGNVKKLNNLILHELK